MVIFYNVIIRGFIWFIIHIIMMMAFEEAYKTPPLIALSTNPKRSACRRYYLEYDDY
jgi:hypothetical protein